MWDVWLYSSASPPPRNNLLSRSQNLPPYKNNDSHKNARSTLPYEYLEAPLPSLPQPPSSPLSRSQHDHEEIPPSQVPNVPPPLPLRFRGPLGTAILYSTSHTSYRTSTPARHPDNSLQLRCPSQGNRPHPHLHLFKSRCCSKIIKKKSNLFYLQFQLEFEHFSTKKKLTVKKCED